MCYAPVRVVRLFENTWNKTQQRDNACTAWVVKPKCGLLQEFLVHRTFCSLLVLLSASDRLLWRSEVHNIDMPSILNHNENFHQVRDGGNVANMSGEILHLHVFIRPGFTCGMS